MRCACCNAIQTQVEQKIFRDFCRTCYKASRYPNDIMTDYEVEIVVDYVSYNRFIRYEQIL